VQQCVAAEAVAVTEKKKKKTAKKKERAMLCVNHNHSKISKKKIKSQPSGIGRSSAFTH
jgi:hypothetical protein